MPIEAQAQVTTQELVASAPGPTSILAIIASAASDPTCNVDKLERLLAIRDKEQAAQLEKEFNAALTRAQMRMKPISTDATNTSTHSKYATYGKLDNALRPIYTDEGFALSFNTTDSPKPEHVRVLCYVSHKRGHSRTYLIDMPVDGKGPKGNDVMTKTHAVGSGAQYGMRYLLKMIFNVAIGEADDDGNGGEVNPDVIATWTTRINAAKTTEELDKISNELATSGVSPAARKAIRPAGAKRREELKVAA